VKNKNLTRREFVKYSGISALATSFVHSPLQILFQSLLDGIINNAIAQTSGTNPRTYVYLSLPGGPPCWTWSQFLTPYSTTGYQHNQGVGTRYVATNGVYTDVAHSTVTINGVNVPHMWQFNVASPNGGMRPMADLLRHLLSVQGISSGNSSHPGSRSLQMLPIGARQSVMAMAGDASNAPIPGIAVSSLDYVYKSIAGKTALIVPQVNTALNDILDAFKRNAPATFIANRQLVDSAIDQAVNTLNAAAESSHVAAAAIADTRRSAKSVVASGVANFGDAFTTLGNKYNDLIRRTVDPTIVLPGLNDLPIGITGTRTQTYGYNNRIVNNADLRSMITTSTGNNGIARAFAVAEYVLTNRLTSSFTCALGGLGGLNINGPNAVQGFDEHSGGKMPSLLINAQFFRAISACLLELIEQLKARNLFNDTIINVAGEFTRSPQDGGTGTDHGWRAANITAFTGMVNSPVIIGNIKNSTDTNYHGTWGEGGPISALGGATLDLGHSTSTLAALLNVPTPITAKPSLVRVQDGVVVPNIEATRIV